MNSLGGLGVIELASLLGVAFIVLKLCRVIDWSWLWVVSPLWITLGVLLVVGLMRLLAGAIPGRK